MSDTLKQQRKVINEWGIAQSFNQYNENCQHIHINKKVGTGSFETYDFDKCQFSKVNCQFHTKQEITNNDANSEFTLFFVLQGQYAYHSDKEIYPIKAPAVFLVKGKFGAITAHLPANERVNALQIILQQEYISILSKQLNFSQHNNQSTYQRSLLWHFQKQQDAYIQLPLSNTTQQFLQKAWQLFHMPAPHDEMSLMKLQGSTLSFLVEMLTTDYDTFYKIDADIPNYVLQAKILLDNSYHENMKISELAKKVGTNECYLKKDFKKLTGLSIHQYRLHKRMARSQEMLNNNISTTDIARQLGFASHHYFLKVFQKFHQ